MTEKIKLVQGDTKPTLVITITDETTGLPISISNAIPRLKMRELGSTTLKTTLTGTPVPGLLNADGTVDTSGAYATPGAGGRCAFAWTQQALDKAGDFEGEIEVTFADGTIQTVFGLLKFKIREQF